MAASCQFRGALTPGPVGRFGSRLILIPLSLSLQCESSGPGDQIIWPLTSGSCSRVLAVSSHAATVWVGGISRLCTGDSNARIWRGPLTRTCICGEKRSFCAGPRQKMPLWHSHWSGGDSTDGCPCAASLKSSRRPRQRMANDPSHHRPPSHLASTAPWRPWPDRIEGIFQTTMSDQMAASDLALQAAGVRLRLA